MKFKNAVNESLLAIILLSTSVIAQETLSTKVEKVDQIFSVFGIETPGGVVAVTHKGKVVYVSGYGNANLDYNIPIVPQTVFTIGSSAKQFTAMTIIMFSER